MSAPARLGIAQLVSGALDPAGARERSVVAARALLEGGADIAILPELAVPGYAVGDQRLRAMAEPLDGPTVTAWRRLAADYGALVCGGFAERDGDALFNAAVVVGPDGVLLHYRKLHPFAREKELFTPGNLGLPVVDTPLGQLGVCVCYDLRFVETVRVLSLQGAELVCVPTAWVAGFDEVRWDAEGLAPQAQGALLQANLNQVFIACASQAGEHDGLAFLGSSIVAGPRGERLLGPLPGTVGATAVVDVDLADARAAQVRDPLITPRSDRRTDVYGLAFGREIL